MPGWPQCMYFNDHDKVLKSDAMPLITTYCMRLLDGKMNTFIGKTKTIEMVREFCGGNTRRKVFLPMCKNGYWGYFVIESSFSDAICKGASVSWGDSKSEPLTTHIEILHGIVALLHSCFPSVSFSWNEKNHYREK